MHVSPRGRVLIVDDDERLGDALREYLAKYLLHTRIARSVQEAIYEISVDRFDVIVLDWILSDGDGRMVLEYADEVSPETVKIVYSAHRTSDAECTAARADHFVEKSHDTSHIRNAIERGLAHRANAETAAASSEKLPTSPQHLIWGVVRDFLPTKPVDQSEILVIAKDDVMAREYAEWQLREVVGQRPIREIDAARISSSSESVVRLLSGECIGRGIGNPVVTRGLFDSQSPDNLLIHQSQELDSSSLEFLAGALRQKRFRRVGSDRDLELRVRISFAATSKGEFKTRWRRSIGSDYPLHEIEIPDSPQAICDGDEWVNRIVKSSGASCVNDVFGVTQLLSKLTSALTWPNLMALAEAIDHNSQAASPSNWITTIPFFESSLIQSDDEGKICSWKEISDVPRFIYICWLLNKTAGNVAEASRLSGLTRAAIYSVIKDRKIDQQAFRQST